MKKNKKQVLIALVIVLILFAVSLPITLFLSSKKSVKNKNLTLKFDTSNEITINSKLPISDTLGKSITKNTDVESYIEFSVVNPSKDSLEYDIYLTKKNINNSIKGNYVKFYLTDEVDNPVLGFNKNKIPTYVDLGYLNDKPGSKLLYRDFIKPNSTKNYKLRVWISDSYAVGKIVENFESSVYIRVK